MNPHEFEFPSEDDRGIGQTGRPSKLTKEMVSKLLEALKVGATYNHAAWYAGVDPSTITRYMRRGAKEFKEGKDTPHANFYLLVKEADGCAIKDWLNDLNVAAKNKQWQASAWRLERRRPKEYGRYAVNEDGDSAGDASGVSLDELIETLREVLLAKGVEVDLSAEDVTRAYLRRKVGKERLGVTQPDDEEG